jgi:hypothetical protein
MPLDGAGDLLVGPLRWLLRVVVEAVFELAIRGAGHLILYALFPRHRDVEWLAVLVGLLFWGVVVTCGLVLYSHHAG